MKSLATRTIYAAALLAFMGLAVASVRPRVVTTMAAPDLESMMPEEFDVWRRIAVPDAVLPQETELGPGEAVVYRAYADDLGRIVTVVAAYGPPLGDSVRLHRPEKCYVAQGFEIRARERGVVADGARSIPVVHLDAQSPSRREGVSYWLRAGDGFTTRFSEEQGVRLLSQGAAPADGALVRVSTISPVNPQFELHTTFMQDFVDALSPEARTVLIGGSPEP
jgi:EpsI family protein